MRTPPGQKATPWEDVAEPTQQAWDNYAKRRGME